eukprot:221125-Pelagomonas_calceolata.AAC.2
MHPLLRAARLPEPERAAPSLLAALTWEQLGPYAVVRLLLLQTVRRPGSSQRACSKQGKLLKSFPFALKITWSEHEALLASAQADLLPLFVADASRRGMGAIMLRKPRSLAKMVNGIVNESELPVTVKIRIGAEKDPAAAPFSGQMCVCKATKLAHYDKKMEMQKRASKQ